MRFPHYIFNPYHGMTLRDRAAKLCEYSLLKWLPKIQLCADESLAPGEVRNVFDRCGITVEVWTSRDLDRALAAGGQNPLRRFAEAFFWGRKTAFTFGLTDALPVLYADLDVLWFSDPWAALGLQQIKSILAGTDRFYSFEPAMLSLMSPEHRNCIQGPDPVCAGLYAVGPGFQLPPEIVHYIELQLKAGKPGHFCEQTLLALAVKLAGSQIPFERLPTCPFEETVLQPSYAGKQWIAAHYAGPTRPQFWRDALSHVR